jgi:uncharacterized membrane protein
MLAFDAAWIGGNRSMYASATQAVQHGQPMQVNILATVLSYALIYAALVGVCLPPVTTDHHQKARIGKDFVLDAAKKSVLRAGTVGLIIYGVYNMTTKALLHKYPWKVCALDTAWGTFMFTAVCFITVVLTKAISK